MVILGLVFLLSCFGIMGQVVRRWFPSAPTAAYLLSVAALMLGSQLYVLLERPYIYEYALVCGAALLLLGLWLWLSAAATPVEHSGVLTVRLAFGSLCVALVAGCRPQMELFALLALPIFWNRYITRGRLRTRAAVREGLAFLLPVVLVAAGLMWYNYARFGSPFDFGANYNITGNDMTSRGFNVVRLGPAVFTSLLEPVHLKGVSPIYLKRTCIPMRSSAPSAKSSPAACWRPHPSPGRCCCPLCPGRGAACTAAVRRRPWCTVRWRPCW